MRILMQVEKKGLSRQKLELHHQRVSMRILMQVEKKVAYAATNGTAPEVSMRILMQVEKKEKYIYYDMNRFYGFNAYFNASRKESEVGTIGLFIHSFVSMRILMQVEKKAFARALAEFTELKFQCVF